MSNSTEAHQPLKILNANSNRAVNVKGKQRVSPSRLFLKRFLKVLLTIYLIGVLAYALVQAQVSESILGYLKTKIEIIKD